MRMPIVHMSNEKVTFLELFKCIKDLKFDEFLLRSNRTMICLCSAVASSSSLSIESDVVISRSAVLFFWCFKVLRFNVAMSFST